MLEGIVKTAKPLVEKKHATIAVRLTLDEHKELTEMSERFGCTLQDVGKAAMLAALKEFREIVAASVAADKAKATAAA